MPVKSDLSVTRALTKAGTWLPPKQVKSANCQVQAGQEKPADTAARLSATHGGRRVLQARMSVR